jgi:hypothetical protein
MAIENLSAPSNWLAERSKVNRMMQELYAALHHHSNKAILDEITAAFTTADKTKLDTAAQTDANGKLVTSAIPDAVLAGLQWQSVWDVATNTPAIPAAAAGNNRHFYQASTAGTSSITGASVAWQPGDWLISKGTAWERVPRTLPLINDLTTGGTSAALTAEQGKTLRALDIKQHTTARSYVAGETVLNGSIAATANADIPATVTFTWGTSGQTWSPVLTLGASSGVWRGLFAANTSYIVGDVFVHSVNRWAPLMIVTTAFTSDATGTMIQQCRTVGGNHNNKVAVYASGHSSTSWAEHMFTPATSTAAGSIGNVPAPSAGQHKHILTGEGWTYVINDQSSSGYVDIGAMRIQWGYIATGGAAATRTILLPAAFANTSYSVVSNPDDGVDPITQTGRAHLIGVKTTTQFRLQSLTGSGNTSNLGLSWQAIGLKP